MDFKQKYLKYKNKYLQLKNQIYGGIDKSITTDADVIDFLNHLNLVSSQDDWNFYKNEDNLFFAYREPGDIDSHDIIDIFPLLHPYPTVHTVWGTLVYPHSAGSWEFSKCAVIVKASDYKDRIYKLNPYDTMLLIDKFIINKNVDVVISQSRFIELSTKNQELLKLLEEKANSVTIYDDSPQDDFKDLTTPTNLVKFKTNYKTNYNSYFNINSTDTQIDEQIDNVLNLLLNVYSPNIASGDYTNGLIAGLFLNEDNGTKFIDPYIFAKTYFKTCLRDAIDTKINEMQKTKPETEHINVQIYCKQIDKETRIHNPVCYRKIHSGETDILKSYDNTKDYEFKGNNIPQDDESSILGRHGASLLNNDKKSNPILKFINYCIDNIKSKTPVDEAEIKRQLDLIKPQYTKLKERKVLPLPFKDSSLQPYLLTMLQINFNNMKKAIDKQQNLLDKDIEEFDKLHKIYADFIRDNTN